MCESRVSVRAAGKQEKGQEDAVELKKEYRKRVDWRVYVQVFTN